MLQSTKIKKLYTDELDQIFRSGEKTISGGDLNSKHRSWNCCRENKTGRKLAKYISERNYLYAASPLESTFHNRVSNDVLDFFILQNINMPITVNTYCELKSDHNPVIATINLSLASRLNIP